jgi:MATE family multidrug resistance protein
MKKASYYGPTIKLAVPVAISQVGHMAMGMVDTIMVGHIGPIAIASVGMGTSLFWFVGLICTGLLLSLDHLVSFSYGKNDLETVHPWLVLGCYVALFSSLPLAFIIYVSTFYLKHLGINLDIAEQTGIFLRVYCWSLVPMALFMAFRQYLQALNRVKFVTLVMILANGANIFFNWVFIFGHLGSEPLGVVGSAIGTAVTRTIMLLAVAFFTYYSNKQLKFTAGLKRWKYSSEGMGRLLKLGVPASGQMFLEVGAFSLTSVLAAKVSVAAAAAHSIVLNIASFTFMVPLGISAAAAILVGQALGAGDTLGAKKFGNAALVIGTVFMMASGVFLYIFSKGILRIYTQDLDVLGIGSKLIVLAALFQIADGVQVIGTGALRGLGDTKSALFANFVGYWIFGLPLGIYLCFYTQEQIKGIWVGLASGLFIVGIMILRKWDKNPQFKEQLQ